MVLEFDGMLVEPTNCEATIEKDKVLLSAACPCGQSRFAIELSSPKSEILEKLEVCIKEKENNPHSGGAFEMDTSKTTRFDCTRCGREIIVSARFTLTDAEWVAVQKRWSEGSVSMLYKGLIQIESRVSHGYFGNYDCSALFVRCQHCHSKSPLSEAIQYFNSLCDGNAAKILEFDSAVEPRTILMTVKCPACLREMEATCTIGVQKPKTAQQFIEVWKLWNPSFYGVGAVSAPDASPQTGQTGLVTGKR
ncbi:hypothetical protein MUO83_02410 [Candidatus Bathyarchaeota archaeon]|nr:hypothetical protein [Candidatus Bathyarchaeota archaeon]